MTTPPLPPIPPSPNTLPSDAAAAVREASHWIQPLRNEIGRWLIGQTNLVDRLLISLLVRGHILVEGVPGSGKTTLADVVS